MQVKRRMKDRTNRIEHREVNTLEAGVCSRNAKETEPANLVVEMTASHSRDAKWRVTREEYVSPR